MNDQYIVIEKVKSFLRKRKRKEKKELITFSLNICLVYNMILLFYINYKYIFHLYIHK